MISGDLLPPLRIGMKLALVDEEDEAVGGGVTEGVTPALMTESELSSLSFQGVVRAFLLWGGRISSSSSSESKVT